MDTALIRLALLSWFDQHARDLPWRMVHVGGGRDPYRVWVSEILLQQTQVSRGKLYFYNFVAQFPDVWSLAAAPQEAVLKAWEGCGYYARARNLHKAAQQVALTGLPTTYEGWLSLPGVGPYTAAAVSSLAYGEARAVSDGNVRRVLARLYAQAQPTTEWVQSQANLLLDLARPGDWNEAVMDLGATICTPKAPKCQECPLSAHCAAYSLAQSTNAQARRIQPTDFPAPKTRAAIKALDGVALILTTLDTTDPLVYLEQRTGTLLGGLYGLPIQEGEPQRALAALCERLGVQQGHAQYLGAVQHTMTHRRISLQVYHAALPAHLNSQRVSERPLSRLDHKILALLRPVQERLM